MGNGPLPADRLTVEVALGPRTYEVVVGPGLIEEAGDLIAASFRGRCAVVTDDNAARRHLEALVRSLQAGDLYKGHVVLEPGEGSKSFRVLQSLCERLLQMGLERGDMVVAFGGGAIGDLAGFAASILRRGVRTVQIPTTLLAQVDSSVGGKTGINTPQGKNLIGTFHQPSLVLADTGVLKTLPLRQLRAGYSEIVKYGLLGDASFFDWLEVNGQDVLAGEPAAQLHAIHRSVRMKAEIVARDETETGERALLNLGHTFAHALEAWAGYSDRLLHGEAVAIGLCLAFCLSEHVHLCPPQTAHRVAAHLASAGLPTRISHIPGDMPDAAQLVRLMGQDKKVRDGRLTFVLARGIGQAFVARDLDVSAEVLGEVLRSSVGNS
ncbi:MAG: 3-dehydroquinate synthase [Hyphomicrobiaceae bacterium]